MSVPGRERDLRRDVPGRDRRHPPVQDPRKLVGYLGLDPKVRQSGSGPGTQRPDLKAGLAAGALGAGRSVLERRSGSPGRCARSTSAIRARRGHQVAIVAAARKLACLFWCLLTRDEDYAYQQPSLTAQEAARLEIDRRRQALRPSGRRDLVRPTTRCAKPRRKLAQPGRGVLRADGPRLAGRQHRSKVGASVTPGRASIGPRRAKPRGRPQAPDVCASLRQSLAPTNNLPPSHWRRQPGRKRPRANSRQKRWPRPDRAHRTRSAALRRPSPTDRSPEQTSSNWSLSH